MCLRTAVCDVLRRCNSSFLGSAPECTQITVHCHFWNERQLTGSLLYTWEILIQPADLDPSRESIYDCLSEPRLRAITALMEQP